jgi:prepilin-type N-terminal cleavage/methylation domain-containing protein
MREHRSPQQSRQALFGASKGFSAIEVLLVMALVAFVAGMGLTVSFSSIAQSNAVQERDLLASLLISARARALANVNEREHGVHIDSTEYIIFEVDAGDDFADRDTDYDRVVERNDAVDIDPMDSEIIFEQLSGNVSTGIGDYTITQGENEQVVSINAAGRIDW